MKKALCAAVLVLIMASAASAGWIYPTTTYYPVVGPPVYAYPTATYVQPTPVMVARPVVENVVTPVVPACGVCNPYIVTPPQYYIPGVPVENRMRVNRIFW